MAMERLRQWRQRLRQWRPRLRQWGQQLLRLRQRHQNPPCSPTASLPTPQGLPSSSSSSSEEEEEEVRPQNYYQGNYEDVVELINQEPITSFGDHAKRLISAARRSKEPLNLIGDSVLHEVIARRKTDLALAIVNLPDNFNRKLLRRRNNYGNTPLHIAAAKGDSTMVEALLKKNPRLGNERNKKGETPLHKAVQSGHLEMFLGAIIRFGDESMAYDRTADGSTILHYAIMHDRTKESLTIASKFPRLVQTRNENGGTPLHIMAEFFKEPPKTGILIYLLYKCKIHFKSTGRDFQEILPPNRGNWRSCLAEVIGNLRKRIGKAIEERSNYEMNMKLLELLVPKDAYLSFYFGGFTSQKKSINRSAGGTSDTPDWKDVEMQEQAKSSHGSVNQSPLITGIKLGIDDFVIKLLQVSPWLANCVDNEGRNVVQAAVEYGRKRVVKAIKDDKRLPPWLFASLESGTRNTLLHIAATNKNMQKGTHPLRLQEELEWFEMVEKIVPEEMLNNRNSNRKTAQEVFTEKHEVMLDECRRQLAEIGRTCSPLVAAAVFTSSFYIPGDHNRNINRLPFKIFSHVYVVGFSCASTSLAMFLMLVVKPFKQRDFRWVVPWYYGMARFLLAMSLVSFIVAFACNMYLQIYGEQTTSRADLAKLLLELLLAPFLCVLSLISLTGVFSTFGIFKRLAK